jgi:hypothetical protein
MLLIAILELQVETKKNLSLVNFIFTLYNMNYVEIFKKG